MIAYVSIGNSDDKLTQKEWAAFCEAVDGALDAEMNGPVVGRHGFWTSMPTAEWQNACWCVVVTDKRVAELQAWLSDLAEEFRQDSIAWAEVKRTTFLAPPALQDVASPALASAGLSAAPPPAPTG